MDTKYIVIKFDNARLFKNHRKTKDFTSELSFNRKGNASLQRKKRSNKNFIEPITVHQISNMLHTLVGERPVPSFREVFYKRNEDIFNLANSSLLKIDSPNRKTKETEDFISEKTHINKSANNSWAKPRKTHWYNIMRFMGDGFYEFIEIINSEIGYNVLEKDFHSLKLYDPAKSKLPKTIEFLKKNKKTPIIHFLTSEKGGDVWKITMSNSIGLVVSRGIDDVYVLSGEILVPYEREFANKLIKNSTNILDGGIAKIVDIKRGYQINMEGFRRVKDISVELTK